jgi:hypothetical protein
MKRFLLFPALCLVFGLAGCSRSEPKISFGTIRLVRCLENGAPAERYTFFVIPDDGDGFEDLADLYLYHDREGLCWRIGASEWTTVDYGGKTWIGTRNIAAAPGEPLPRGQFRAVLVDRGGEKSERNFAFDAPAASRFPFPEFSVAGGRYTAKSQYPANHVVFYDAGGVYMGTKTLLAAEGNIRDLAPPSGAAGAALWAEDAENMSSAVTEIAALGR